MKNGVASRIALQSEPVAGEYETINVTHILDVAEGDFVYIQNYWEQGTQTMWGGQQYGYTLLIEQLN